MKLVSSLFLSVLMVVAGCSSNEGETPGTNEPSAHFFKATGGSQHDLMPLAGVRIYSNTIYTHVFHRDCDADKSGALQDVSNTSGDGKSSKIGAIAQSKALCGYDAAFFWENGKLIVRDGDLGFGPTKWPGDVEYTEVSQAEFIKELKAQTQDRGFNYRTLERSEREEFDEACKDLTGKICSDLF